YRWGTCAGTWTTPRRCRCGSARRPRRTPRRRRHAARPPPRRRGWWRWSPRRRRRRRARPRPPPRPPRAHRRRRRPPPRPRTGRARAHHRPPGREAGAMAFRHVALATTALLATHRFYTEAMGFTLVKAVVAPTPEGQGIWAKHVFYDTGGTHQPGAVAEGGELLAFWELNGPQPPAFDPAMSTSHGLPVWTNHLAFFARDLDDLHARRDHWLACGH